MPNVSSKYASSFIFVSRKKFGLPLISAADVINTIDFYKMHLDPEMLKKKKTL